MTLDCGALIHIRCFKILLLRQMQKVHKSKRKRYRIRGLIGMPVFWYMCKCPGCNEYIRDRDLAIFNQRWKQRDIERNVQERTHSPTSSSEADLGDISERDFE